jgi:hypothetical protein
MAHRRSAVAAVRLPDLAAGDPGESRALIMTAVFSLIPLAVLALIVWGVIAAVRGGEEEDEPAEPGIGTVRRLFIYGVALLAAFLGAWGVSLLLGGAIDTLGPSDLVIGDADTGLALGLAMTVVGVPTWALFWLASQRSLREHGVERRSVARRSYLGVVRAVALVVVMVNAVPAVESVLGVASFEGARWGWALTWAGLWLFHERAAATEPAPTVRTRLLDRVYLYFASAVALGVLVTAAGRALYEPLRVAYEALFLSTAVDDDLRSSVLREVLALALIGAPVWYWHWLRSAVRDVETMLWLVYLFMLGVLGGLIAAVVGSGTVVHQVIAWLLGATDKSAAVHFDVLPGALSAIAIGVAVWGYHRLVQSERMPADAEGSGRGRTEPERVYRYLVAAAGLATLASGLIVVFVLAVEALAPGADVIHRSGWWREPLAVVLTLLLVGVPLWGWYWFRLQRVVAEGAAEERTALSRRAYIFGVAGLGVLTALVNLIAVLFQAFEAVLEGELSPDVAFDARWSIALLLMAGTLGAYHWAVLREDRQALAEAAAEAPPVRPKQVVLVATGGGEELAASLQRLGSRVRRWRRLDGEAPAASPSEQELRALHERIAAAEGERVVMIVDADGNAEVVPYTVES